MRIAAHSEEEIRAARLYHEHRDAVRHELREARRRAKLEAVRRAIRELAPREPTLRTVWLFGSILRPGHFGKRSDVDVAVDSADPAAESRFWRALEDVLDIPVDVRPPTGAVATAVEHCGERVYERDDPRPRAKHR